jgi:hypothetical protein
MTDLQARDNGRQRFIFAAFAHFVGFILQTIVPWAHAPGFKLPPAPQARQDDQ